jgi:hypothetical protein
MFDPKDRLFAMESRGGFPLKKGHEGPAGSKVTKETGLGIDFGASPSCVANRFGKPDRAGNWGDLSAYVYWVEKDGVLWLNNGYKCFGFHGGKLDYISVFFIPFTLPHSVTYGESKSDVIKAYGKPQGKGVKRLNPMW